MQKFFLTLGFSGLSPKAPGTVGSFVALILGILFLIKLPPLTMFLFSIFVTLIAIKQINLYEQTTGIHDDKSIVIDEFVGMWIALSIAPAKMLNTQSLLDFDIKLWIPIILSFIFFRIYDIKKPSIIGRIDQKVDGGLGVMGDDIIAGFAAGITSALFTKIIFDYLI